MVGGSVWGKTPSLMLKQQHNSKVKNRMNRGEPPSLLYAIGYFFFLSFLSRSDL
jgi:hypothetical protein